MVGRKIVNRAKKKAYWNMYIDRLKRYGVRHLEHCYDRPSSVKQNVWDLAKRQFAEEHGMFLSIITYNTFMFTYGFIYKDYSTGESFFHVETPYYCGRLLLESEELNKLRDIMGLKEHK